MAQEIPITPPGGEPPQGSKGRPDLKVVPEQTVAKPGATSDASNVIHLDTHPLAQQSNISSGEQHETTEEAVKHALDAERLAQLETSRAADLDAVITRAHTTNTPKKHGLPYRVMHSRPVKVAAAVVAAVGLVGALQELPKFETKTNPTPSGEVIPGQIGSVSAAIIPSESQAPESVPLTELTKTNGALKIDKKTQNTFTIVDATIIKITTNPDNQDEIWLTVKLPGDTLTKTDAPGDWTVYEGLTVEVEVNQYTYYDVGGNAETIVSLTKPVYKVGNSITALGAIIPNATGYPQTEANNAINETLKSVDANVGKPNDINSGYKLVALTTSS